MSLNHQKGMVQVDTPSAYPARYRSASFTPGTCKYLIGNLKLEEMDGQLMYTYAVPESHMLHVWGHWLIPLLNDNVTALKAFSPDEKAVMRRVAVCYTDSIWGAAKTTAAPSLMESWSTRIAILDEMDNQSDNE